MPDWLKVILLLLLAFLLLIVVPFVGLLIFVQIHDMKYAHIAREIIDPMAAEYVQEVYPDRDFVVEASYYAFKDNCFYVPVYSPSSVDTHFRLSYDYKTYEFQEDTYERMVLGGGNTRNRVVEEYQAMVQECLGSMDGVNWVDPDFCRYSANEQRGLYYSPQGLAASTLIVDHPYDVAAMGWDYGYLVVTFLEDEENINLQRAYERMLEIDELMAGSGIGYHVLEVTLSNGKLLRNTVEFTIYGVRREDLASEDPLERLQEMWDEQEAHRQEVRAQWENDE